MVSETRKSIAEAIVFLWVLSLVLIAARWTTTAYLVVWHSALAALPLREDLRTRLGWGLVYELLALEDEDGGRLLRLGQPEKTP